MRDYKTAIPSEQKSKFHCDVNNCNDILLAVVTKMFFSDSDFLLMNRSVNLFIAQIYIWLRELKMAGTQALLKLNRTTDAQPLWFYLIIKLKFCYLLKKVEANSFYFSFNLPSINTFKYGHGSFIFLFPWSAFL